MESARALQSGAKLCILSGTWGNSGAGNPKSQLSTRRRKGFCSVSVSKTGKWGFGTGGRNSGRIRASSLSSSSESSSPIAPLQLESPVGQFLSQILLNHPHLLPAAVDRQLEQLQTVSEAEKNSEDHYSPSGSDLVLYRRIAELKANERRMALEEILYTLVVQKFVEADVPLVPAISQPAEPSVRVDQWLPLDGKLERLHSIEAFEMIKNHLALILGPRLEDPKSVAPISKLRVGQVYAASIMYGYFLKRVDQRFQLEKSMRTLPWGSEEEEDAIKQAIQDETRPSSGIAISQPLESSRRSESFRENAFNSFKLSRLRSYIMSFDSETMQRYATIRSKEAFNIIEKHTEALFGRPDVLIMSQATLDSSNDDLIKISFGGLTRLILEAVTFGSFLWDVESYAMSRYSFAIN